MRVGVASRLAGHRRVPGLEFQPENINHQLQTRSPSHIAEASVPWTGSDIRGLTPGLLLSPIHEAPSPAPSPENASDASQSASVPADSPQRGECPLSGSRAAATYQLAASGCPAMGPLSSPAAAPQQHPDGGNAARSGMAAAQGGAIMNGVTP